MPNLRNPTILALDPGTKEMGIALLNRHELLGYRVKTFRNGRKPHELLEQAKLLMIELLKEMKPDIVVIERPFFAKTKRSALLVFLVQELKVRVAAHEVALREYDPREVRQILLDNSRATKRDIARFVIDRFPELKHHFHPGVFWKEKYWSHIFDAVALGLADMTRDSKF